MDYFDTDPQRTVRNIRVRRGGIFSGGEVDIEYDPIVFTFTDKAKTTIICNACQGAGEKASPYGGKMKCMFCDGKGTLKLKKATKKI